MNKIQKLQFQIAVEKLGISEGDNLFVHSDLLRLGYPVEGIGMYLDVLREAVGVNGSLIAPTFTFAFMSKNYYHYKKTKPISMGFISNQLLDVESSVRSKHPINSLVFLGPLAEKFKDFEYSSGYADDGVFNELLNHNVKIALIGAAPSHISYSHLSEEKIRVPYRKMLEFVGQVVFSDEDYRSGAKYNFFGRDLKEDVKLGGYDTLVTELVEAGFWSTHCLGNCNLFCGTAQSYVANLSAKLQVNPLWLVEKELEK